MRPRSLAPLVLGGSFAFACDRLSGGGQEQAAESAAKSAEPPRHRRSTPWRSPKPRRRPRPRHPQSRRPPSRRFVESELSDRLLDDLERARPAFVILGSTAQREQFRELQAVLRRDYRLGHAVRVGRVQVWRRKDLARQ